MEPLEQSLQREAKPRAALVEGARSHVDRALCEYHSAKSAGHHNPVTGAFL